MLKKVFKLAQELEECWACCDVCSKNLGYACAEKEELGYNPYDSNSLTFCSAFTVDKDAIENIKKRKEYYSLLKDLSKFS
jgi:hypothetical protein